MERVFLFLAPPLVWLSVVVFASELTDLNWQVSPVLLQGLQLDFGQDADRVSARLPALGEKSRMGFGREGQETTKDAWGKVLFADIADILVAAGDDLNSNRRQVALAALADQTQRKVKKRLSDRAAAATESWLGQFGQARVSYGMGANVRGRLRWRLDYSQPLYQSASSTWLMELGGRPSGDSYLVDSGLVCRYETKGGQVWGMNAFVDQDVSWTYIRGSIGLEWMTLWSELTANVYRPLSGWREKNNYLLGESADTEILAEVGPAHRLDIDLKGIVPFYRALSITASYAHWLGRHIDVAGRERELWAFPNTKAWSVAWHPVPLLTVSFSQTFMPGSQRNYRLQTELSFDLGAPAGNRFRPIASMLSAQDLSYLRNHRFSHRNTDMTLAYRGDAQGRGRPLSLPKEFDLTLTGDDLQPFVDDTGGRFLAQMLTSYNTIKIEPHDGVDFHYVLLPDGKRFRNKVVVIVSNNNWGLWVHYSGKKTAIVDQNQPYILKNIDGIWHLSGSVGGEIISD